MKICVECGKQISKNGYRCRTCYYVYLKTRFFNNRITCVCSYCRKEFYRSKSTLKNSRSGLYFCCREHKNLSQQVSFGLKKIQPPHYKDGLSNYRQTAYKHYGKVCNNCGYDKHSEVLEVHHIDGNKKNNHLENLIVFCANCHKLLTSKKGYLQNRKLILS